MSRLGVLLALVVVAASGCYGGSDGERESARDDAPLTATELGWVRGYSAWTIAVNDEELGPPAGPRLVAACRERLEAVGPAPTPRLEPAAKVAATACPLLARRGTHRRALDTLEVADDLLLPLLRDEQPLALDGVTDASRADVELSAFATEMIGEPVEVRCWDEQDWRRVVYEDNAWNDSDDDPEALVGWADDATERIHMQVVPCNTIARLGGDDPRGWALARQIEAADAIGTLVHEVQHFVRPDADEAAVECVVLRTMRRAAAELGASESTALLLAKLYRTDVYPDQPTEYVTENCSL